jgi:hypothetical protein
MDEILILSILIGFIIILLYLGKKDKYEGFYSLVNPIIKNNLGNEHSSYIERGADNYNPIMNLMNPLNNTLLPPNFSETNRSTVEQNIRNALVSAKSDANDPSFKLTASKTADIRINKNAKGTVRYLIKNAEAVKTVDCNSFNNTEFAESAGICHEGGVDSGGNPIMGGLYISQDDKETAEIMAKRMNSKEVNYTPTVGKCDPYRFSTSKQQCLDIQNELNCIKKQSIDNTGCGLCFTDDKYHYIDSNTEYTPPSFVFVGSGTLSYIKVGSSKPETITLSSSPQTIEATDLNEGDIIQLNVTPATASIAGYLIGQTNGGDFRIDISRLIQSDTITGTRPRLAGMMNINSDSYTLIKPGRGKDRMSLSVLNTFSFLDVSEYPAMKCPSGPYVKKEASLNFLNNSPCYKKGQVPGAYSLECLQQVFQSAGCTTDGIAYPSDSAKAQGIMRGVGGELLTIGKIAELVYNNSIFAYTGKNANGVPLSIANWNTYSQFCTGKTITSPCDTSSLTGIISTDCLNYLWQNAGVNNNNTGSTYSGSDSRASLDRNNNNRFCTANGTLSPLDTNGNQNDTAVNLARSMGDVESIKSFYDSIHLRANNNTLYDDERKNAVEQCYGINFIPAPPQDYDSNTVYRVNDRVIFNGFTYKMVESTGVPGHAPNARDTKLWVKI